MARKKQDTLVLFPEVFFSTARMSDAQFGAFMRAVFGYRFTGAVYEGDDLAVDIAFRTVQSQIDRYIEVCKTNQDNASNKNNGEGAAELSGMQGNPAKPNEEKGNAPHTHTHSHNHNPIDNEADKPPAPAKKPFSQYGWVKLTQEEYNRLVVDLGETEAKRCIDYVDEAAQSTGNKNTWKDWNIVVRQCSRNGWGKQQYIATNNRGPESGLDRLARMYEEEFGT